MEYNLNGRVIRIPDKIIANSMKVLNLSQTEAVQMYLEDEGYLENAEQEELNQKAKASKITATIHQARAEKPKKKTQRERVQKDDPTKEKLIEQCAELIRNLCGNAAITNKTKLIAFTLDGENYELNLIRKRKPKN